MIAAIVKPMKATQPGRPGRETNGAMKGASQRGFCVQGNSTTWGSRSGFDTIRV